MEGLVSSIAEVTDDAASLLGEPLHAASGGSPFSALRLLQEANARALVRVENNRWGVVDPVALRALFQRAQTAAGRLSDLGREPLGLLMALAMMDEPLSMRQLIATCGSDEMRVGHDVAELERRGLVLRHGDEWRVAHATIGDDVRAVVAGEQAATVARRLGEFLLVQADDVSTLRRAVVLLLAGGERTMALGAARRWFLEHRGIRLPPDAFVDVLLRGVDDPQFRAHLLAPRQDGTRRPAGRRGRRRHAGPRRGSCRAHHAG
jgi:hypothetical protein